MKIKLIVLKFLIFYVYGLMLSLIIVNMTPFNAFDSISISGILFCLVGFSRNGTYIRGIYKNRLKRNRKDYDTLSEIEIERKRFEREGSNKSPQPPHEEDPKNIPLESLMLHREGPEWISYGFILILTGAIQYYL